MNNIEISEYKEGQEILIYQLIKKVYDEFVSGDYSAEGNCFFYDWIDPLKIRERQKTGRTILVAKAGSKIIGMIEMRNENIVSLLFTDKKYHGQGIAKKLLQESIRKALQINPKIITFLVHASSFSIPVYKKLGFVETDQMQEENGIKYLPMELILRK